MNGDDELDPIMVVRALDLAIERYRQRIAAHFGVPMTDTVALSNLVMAGGSTTARDLADRMGMSSGTMTAVLDRLEARDFAAREPNPDDRRSFLVVLRPEGENLLKVSRDGLGQAIARGLPVADRQRILAGMLQLAAGIDQADVAPGAH